MIVHVSTDYHDLVCKAPSHRKVAVDDRVGLAFDAGKGHLFEPEAGKNVSLAERGDPQG